MYWIDVLSKLPPLFGFLLFVSISVFVVTLMGYCSSLLEDRTVAIILITCLLLIVIFTTALVFTPSAEYLEYLKGGICE